MIEPRPIESQISAESGRDDVLIEAVDISKKFARTLSRSLYYAVRDLGTELTGRSVHPTLRPDEFWALKDISFSVRRGEALGIIGPNGAGKSTLLKIVTGIIKPTTGFVRTRGQVQALIELASGMNPILTGRENIFVRSSFYGIPRSTIEKRFDDIVRFAELEDYIDMPVQNYSSGMRVKLGFSIAINVDPDVLILDEVLAVGDQRFRNKAREAMQELIERNVALVFISHNMQQVQSLTEKVIWIDHGSVRESGNSRSVCAHYLADQGGAVGDDDGPVPISRSVGTVELDAIRPSHDGAEIPRTFSIAFDQANKIYELELTFSVRNQLPGEKFYFALSVTAGQNDGDAYIMIKDVISAPVGGTFIRTFQLDLSRFHPGQYGLTLHLFPAEGITHILYGAFSIVRFSVEPPQELTTDWRPGERYHGLAVGTGLGTQILPAELLPSSNLRAIDITLEGMKTVKAQDA